MIQWEHKIVEFTERAYQTNDAREAFLNALGTEGWELIFLSKDHAYFKRPKQRSEAEWRKLLDAQQELMRLRKEALDKVGLTV